MNTYINEVKGQGPVRGSVRSVTPFGSSRSGIAAFGCLRSRSRAPIMPALITMLLCLFFTVAGCSDSGNEPGPVSHDFTWAVDSILPQYFQFYGKSLWGSSEDNVYLGGHNSDTHEILLKFDGQNWTSIDMRAKKIRYIAAISGIDSNNFVVVGDGGITGKATVYRDGEWIVLTLPVLRIPLTGVHMVSPTEMYISCIDGILRHDGVNYEWMIDSSRTERDPRNHFYPSNVRKGTDGNVYFHSRQTIEGTAYARMNLYDGERLHILEENSISHYMPEHKSSFLRYVGGELVTGYNEIYTLRNGVFHTEHTQRAYIVTGSDIRRNLFSTDREKIYHFNGMDWVDITPPAIRNSTEMYPISDIFYIDSTLFVIFQEYFNTCVYRGNHL